MLSPTFETLSSRTLAVPLSTRPLEQEAVQFHTNRRTGTNAPLATGAMENSHLPLAPGAGISGEIQAVRSSSLQTVAAMSVTLDDAMIGSLPPVPTNGAIAEIVGRLQRSLLEESVEALRNAAVHADRRSSPHLIAQLVQATQRPVDAVICSIVDSDPAAPLLRTLAGRHQPELIAGVAALARLTGAARAAFAATSAMRWDAPNRSMFKRLGIHELSLSGDYPIADPSLMVYACVKRRIRSGRLPTEVGVLLLDAAAAIAVGRWFLLREPMTCVPIAIHDWPGHACRYAIAPVGMPLDDALLQLQMRTDGVIRAGDSLRDHKINTDTIIAGGELVFHLCGTEPPISPDPCIRCGWCVEVCPTGVQPAGILEAAQRHEIELAERMGIDACIDCGLCSYVCASRLPLLDSIRLVKRERERIEATPNSSGAN